MWQLLVRRLWKRFVAFFRSSLPLPPSTSPLHLPKILTNTTNQGIVKGFTSLGFKTQVQPLSSFQESYGLEADEEEDPNEEEDEDEEDDEDGDDSDDETADTADSRDEI